MSKSITASLIEAAAPYLNTWKSALATWRKQSALKREIREFSPAKAFQQGRDAARLERSGHEYDSNPYPHSSYRAEWVRGYNYELAFGEGRRSQVRQHRKEWKE